MGENISFMECSYIQILDKFSKKNILFIINSTNKNLKIKHMPKQCFIFLKNTIYCSSSNLER